MTEQILGMIVGGTLTLAGVIVGAWVVWNAIKNKIK